MVHPLVEAEEVVLMVMVLGLIIVLAVEEEHVAMVFPEVVVAGELLDEAREQGVILEPEVKEIVFQL